MSQNQGGFIPGQLQVMIAGTSKSKSKYHNKGFEELFREVTVDEESLSSRDRAYLNTFKKEKLNGRTRRDCE